MRPPDSEAPAELLVAIQEFFPIEEHETALSVSYLESAWNAFALADTTDADHQCGDFLRFEQGIAVSAERSVGYFQVNACNFPEWEWQRLYNARHNVGTAHLLWSNAGNSWRPWFFTAKRLGLI